MNEIQEMKDRRDQRISEMESLQTALLPYEAVLENPETIEQDRELKVRDQNNGRKRKIDSQILEIYRVYEWFIPPSLPKALISNSP